MPLQPLDPQTIKAISQAAGDVKALCDDLKAAGVSSPALDAADNLAAGVSASLASGSFDPTQLIAPTVAELTELRATIQDPTGKAIIGVLLRLLGKAAAAPGA